MTDDEKSLEPEDAALEPEKTSETTAEEPISAEDVEPDEVAPAEESPEEESTERSEDDEQDPSRPGTGKARRVAIAGVRLVTGIVGIAVAVGVIAAVGLAPAPATRAAPSIRVVPEPAPLARVCPGALLALGDGSGADSSTASSVGRATVVADALGAELDRSTLTPSASEAQLLTASAARRALLAGAQSQTIDTDDLRGLATAACSDPSGSSWLVGGATTTGRTSLLTLSNPTAVDATVDLGIWAENGPVDAPGLQGVIVPAGAEKVLSLAGFAQNATSPVVRVQSRGGRVVAALQESILRAVDPGGVDLAAPSAAGTRLTIPGVELNAVAAVEALRGREDYGDLQPVLRLLDPGDRDTTVRVGIRAEGQGTGTAFTVPLTAGNALDVPIDSLGAGTYTVTLESDVPIVAAARVSSARALTGSDPLESPISDLAWIAPAPEVSGSTAFAAPDLASRLHVVNPGSSDVTLALTGRGTPDLSVTVPAGSAAKVALAAGGIYRIAPSSPVLLQVVSGDDGRISAFPVAPPPAAASPIVLRR